jgi:hypothetical protein
MNNELSYIHIPVNLHEMHFLRYSPLLQVVNLAKCYLRYQPMNEYVAVNQFLYLVVNGLLTIVIYMTRLVN